VAATAAPPVASVTAPGTIVLEFIGPSDQLTTTSLDQLRTIAANRGQRFIVITGRGDAVTSDAVSQAAAVGLALKRAQAIATVLVADGVPSRVLRLDAQAAGRGGDLRLLQ
jgi:outer membrane protein OmpA-like peptidoglycan-associated protein